MWGRGHDSTDITFYVVLQQVLGPESKLMIVFIHGAAALGIILIKV